ncbi:MAG TPA: DnaB-like helicase C-terminal domain-containing protein [Azospirillum sp.]
MDLPFGEHCCERLHIMRPGTGLRNLTVTPPTDVVLEASLIGAVVNRPRVYPLVAHITPDDFADEAHAQIWAAIQAVAAAGGTPDPLTVSRAIAGDDAWRREVYLFLADAVTAVINPAAAPDYAVSLRDLAVKRAVMAAAAEAIAAAGDRIMPTPAGEVASNAVAALTRTLAERGECEDAGAIAARIRADLDRPVRVTRTGLPRFDRLLAGGLYEHKLYGLGARKKNGKTLLLGTIAYNVTIAAPEPDPVVFLALEMDPVEIMHRLLGRHMGVNANAFLDPVARGQPWFRRALEAAEVAFAARGLHFLARPRMSLDALRAELARLGLSGRCRGVILDYAQLVGGRRHTDSGADHLDDVGQTLAEAVKRYPYWILAAAQLNQENNVRGGEGLLNACDMALRLTKVPMGGGANDEAFIEIMDTRYTRYGSVGTENSPAYEVVADGGPYFHERDAQEAA